jgi:hypothetical protein
VLSRLESLRLVADYTLQAIPLVDAERAIREAEGFLVVLFGLITT